MKYRNDIRRFLTQLGVVLFQLFMTLLVTFLLSILVPIEDFPQSMPVLFVVVIGIAFSAGVFIAGWLALKLRWLTSKPKHLLRLIAALVGAYLPLIVALIIYRSLEPGSPFFFISMMTSILLFYVPGWASKK